MSAPTLATVDGIITVSIVLDMMQRGVPPLERRWVLTLLRHRSARWTDAWTDPWLLPLKGATA